MKSRERFFETVTHGHPDRAVFDLCGSPQTVVDYDVTKNELAALLGIEGEKQGHWLSASERPQRNLLQSLGRLYNR